MEFKLTAGEVLQAEISIKDLSNAKMKGVYGISVARLLKSIYRTAERVRKKRVEVIRKNGDLQDDGRYKVKPGHELDLEKDGRALMGSEVTVRGDPLPRGISDVEVEARTWFALLPFLQEELDRKKGEACSDG